MLALSNLAAGLSAQMALRKKLHNELVDLKGNIRVFGRVRFVFPPPQTPPDAPT